MGTLTDILTRNINRNSYHSKDEIPHCLYCKHVRKAHNIHNLTDKHLADCTLNKHARRATQDEILHKAYSQWEPEWNFSEDTSEEDTRLSRELVNQLKVIPQGAKIKIQTERGWLGNIWPSDLDKLSVQFVKFRKSNGLIITQKIWEQALLQFISRSKCNCPPNQRCFKDCKISQTWSLPKHLQFLAKKPD